MEKTLDPHNNIVHLLDRRKKDSAGLLNLCACGRQSGLVWEKIDEDTPLTCLICLMIEKKQERLTKNIRKKVNYENGEMG